MTRHNCLLVLMILVTVSQGPIAQGADSLETIQSQIEQVMGPLPKLDRQRPPKVELVETIERDKFFRKRIRLSIEENEEYPLTADLYLPKGIPAKTRVAAVLALHPTAIKIGKKVISEDSPKVNRSYAAELAERQFVVIAPDYPGMGEYPCDWRKLGYRSASMKAIVNHMRCVDYLCSLAEVDPDRIAVIGHSLGGHNSLFAAAFDRRLKVVVTSCAWTPFGDYKNGNLAGWASDWYMPLLKSRFGLDPTRVPFDFDRLIAALAPRAVFSNSPLHDDNFEVRGVKRVFPEIQEVYRSRGAADRVRFIYPDCQHDFPPEVRSQAYEFIEENL
jgi:acetyl esterase/lipase